MPQSALARLLMDDQALTPGQPMLFQISNPESGRVSHCGVSEFTAEEGSAHVLSWMMENLQLKESDEVRIKSVRLERGSYVKLQPHSVEFFASIRNLKDALEGSLNHSFFCVTTGDTILISHWGKEFYLNVVETRPGPAVSLVDTDCEVEFDTPLDYKEPQPKEKKKKRDAAGELLDESKETKFVAFTGNSRRLSGETGEAPMDEAVQPEAKKLKKLAAAEDKKAGVEQGKFVAFSGSARRLSGGGGGVHQKEDSGVKVTDGGKMEKKEGKAESSGAKKEPCKPFTGRKYTLMD
ncbi:unnamed protein product [Linum tenue]|uniref:Uncharacterized protein n=1 Tax=Linum tenue TaxID=586396 RepID=A0AAV0NR82_9ROSI|nr:unnamed protein product [Linum tenue]